MNKTLYCDLELCMGCGACVVACMDEHDVDVENNEVANRRILKIEQEDEVNTYINFASVSCMHCENSACLIGCPTGAIYRDEETRAILVNQELCIGCHSCAVACPFGVPRYDKNNKLTKCDLCSERQKAGLLPACMRTCPIKALSLLDEEEYKAAKKGKYLSRAVDYIK